MVQFLVAVEPDDPNHANRIIVPDLPCCFSVGDSLDDAVANAKEAINDHLQLL